jgi:BirA family biotin operon repressor/biotin-[acetyl-CoA-carboxylase] ligase
VKWAIQRQLTVKSSVETGSTNEDAKANALRENDDFALYVTAHQTAGRGRGANTWLDTGGGEGLLSTWSYLVSAAPQPIAAPRIGLAVLEAASAVWPSLEWSLKAPNDLFLAGQKMGGLLLESVSSGGRFRLLIGLGLNILNHPRRFDADHLSGILNAAPEEGDWFQFLDELHGRLGQALADCQKPLLSDAVCQALVRALNANPKRPFALKEVTPQGDLVHAQGRVRWMDL